MFLGTLSFLALGASLLQDTVLLGGSLLTAAESLPAAHAGNRS
jgi:hypothetical protein